MMSVGKVYSIAASYTLQDSISKRESDPSMSKFLLERAEEMATEACRLGDHSNFIAMRRERNAVS